MNTRMEQPVAGSREQLLSSFSPITLEEMSGIRLMNRIDTKYILSAKCLKRFLLLVVGDYRVQEVSGEREAVYRTLYLDTPERSMYLAHQCGRAVREKIRVRTYVASGLTFLEVKNKDNKGRTDKKRIPVTSASSLAEEGAEGFLRQYARYGLGELSFQLENRFRRITLVNRACTERLTIDTGICFCNLLNGNRTSLQGLVVVELKRDGRTPSPAREVLRRLHVHPAGFSKYCMGCALTDTSLKQNRFKPRVGKMLHVCRPDFTNQTIHTTWTI